MIAPVKSSQITLESDSKYTYIAFDNFSWWYERLREFYLNFSPRKPEDILIDRNGCSAMYFINKSLNCF